MGGGQGGSKTAEDERQETFLAFLSHFSCLLVENEIDKNDKTKHLQIEYGRGKESLKSNDVQCKVNYDNCWSSPKNVSPV